jgi:hypothetical protein
MKENKVNQNLTIKQAYVCSRHTGPEMNNTAEDYIDSIPAMNAPGGKLLVGYKDPNIRLCHTALNALTLKLLGLLKS